MTWLRCRKVRMLLPGHILGNVPLREADQAHFDHCLVCQADAAGYRTVRRALLELKDETVSAPGWFVTRVMSVLDRPVSASAKPSRARVAVAFLVAGAAVAIWGRRRLRPAS
ncbi:hypothetical protein BMS3Abin02_00162 [bacterium BMS3Abin02]|nr:hypothetical protein BMS3Abin02_00162 [bacterium BMS3Abin02]GBE21228.1 hypothetical protein BMS3Bbin01_00569 [bacterium BMS3Bbin01]HDH25864.1 hypothetical protein [Actinomycetota bacterium]HDK45619.1 hypothetical protein [Actinomycetota bacterium]HDL48664.1 hypothetical protein [Actinomycetota bacterium]